MSYTATELNNEAALLFLEGDDVHSEELYRQALQTDPENASVLNNLGFLLHQQGKTEEAIRLLERSVQINASSSSACLNLGNALAVKGMPNEGIVWMLKAIEADPENIQAWESVAFLYMAHGQAEQAEPCWEQALQLAPGNPKYLIEAGIVKAGLGKLSEAAALLGEALTHSQENTFVYTQLGVVEMMQHNHGLSQKYLKQALGLAPENESARYHLVLTYLCLSDIENAKLELNRLLLINPTHNKALLDLAILDLGDGNAISSTQLLSRLLENEPGNLKAGYYQAVALYQAGEQPAAKKILNKISKDKQHPFSTEAQEFPEKI